MARQRNSIGGVAAGAVVGAATGFALGRSMAVPDIDAKLDEVESLIKQGKDREASDLLISVLDDVNQVYTRMGGAPPELRKRMVKLNNKLSAREQIFHLQEAEAKAKASNPSPTRKLKAKLLR